MENCILIKQISDICINPDGWRLHLSTRGYKRLKKSPQIFGGSLLTDEYKK